jgi:L-glyceraldehyde 3-phosphate reductase
LPAISLGLWHNFGGVDNFENVRKILHHAFDSGITHFDLANNYGPPPGSAEENFGKVFKSDFMPYRDEMIISTKAGYYMWPGPYGDKGSRKYLLSSLDQSLSRMGLEYVDIFYSHRPDPETPLEETMNALADSVKKGKALYAGISNYQPDQTIRAVEILHDLGISCLIHQPRYNMFDRWIEDELLDILEEKGLGCIPFSPLAQGILTDRYINGIPEGSRAKKPHGFLKEEYITSEKIEKVKKLHKIALKRGQTMAQMALAWLLRDKRITSVLVGASTVDQLKDTQKMLENINFSGLELDEIESILS